MPDALIYNMPDMMHGKKGMIFVCVPAAFDKFKELLAYAHRS
jgi:hypothetical protein